MKRLGVGVIGLGVGARHAAAYARRPDCKLVALCDLAPEKLTAIGSQFPDARQTTDASEVLEDPSISVVSIATYDDCHHSQVIRALDCGKHVFVEKPLCLRTSEFLEIQSALARRPEQLLSSNLILRKSPRFIELRRLIREGALGDIYYIEGDYLYGRLEKIVSGWRGQVDGYSVMHGGGIHLIDLLLWLLGDSFIEVTAVGNAIASKGSSFRNNDMVVALLKLKSGAVAKISANFGCVHPHFHAVRVYGTKGTYINGSDAALLFTSREPEAQPQRLTTAYPGMDKGDLIEEFVEAIQGRPSEAISSKEVLDAMAVSLAIVDSVRRGGSPVNLSEIGNP